MASEREIEAANDRVQQAGGRAKAEEVLRGLSVGVLRGVADLNHCDAEAGKERMIRDLLAAL